jgi:hypothetical protein
MAGRNEDDQENDGQKLWRRTSGRGWRVKTKPKVIVVPDMMMVMVMVMVMVMMMMIPQIASIKFRAFLGSDT